MIMSAMEDYNFYGDSRVCGPAPERFVLWKDDEEVELPTKWEVCPVCNGEGKHVNPSIDAGGLSAEDFAEDPDFAEDYMSGVYDVRCNFCRGRRVVRDVDFDQLSEEDAALYERQLEDEAAWAAEAAAERRMGA